MARRLGKNITNEIPINDQISGSEIMFFYRPPTNQERIRYQTALFSVKGFRVKLSNTFELRLKHGMAIITGFRDGDLEIFRDGQWVGISSDQESVRYFKDWREYLEETAADLVVALAEAVFDGARAVPNENEDVATTEDAVSAELPTGKNSRESSIGTLMNSE